MNCKEIYSLFSEYYDQELNAEARALIKEHIANCQYCRSEYKIFRKCIKMLKKMKLVDVPRDNI